MEDNCNTNDCTPGGAGSRPASPCAGYGAGRFLAHRSSRDCPEWQSRWGHHTPSAPGQPHMPCNAASLSESVLKVLMFKGSCLGLLKFEGRAHHVCQVCVQEVVIAVAITICRSNCPIHLRHWHWLSCPLLYKHRHDSEMKI